MVGRTRNAKAQGTGCHRNHDKRAGSFGKLNRYLPLDEACRQDGLHELCRHELGFLRDRFLAQFEDLADRVLPDPALIKNKVARLTERKTDVEDALNEPFLVS